MIRRVNQWFGLVWTKLTSSFFNKLIKGLAILTMNKNNISMNNKVFIFQYDPQASPKKMLEHFKESIVSSKKHIQPKNLLVSNSLEAIYRCLTPARLEIFTCLIEKKPTNLTELSQTLKRDYANV
jgi:predicted transcriptional regulator